MAEKDRVTRIASVSPATAVIFAKAARMTGDRTVEVIAAGPITIQEGEGKPVEVKAGEVGIRQRIDERSTRGEFGSAAFQRNLGILNSKVYGSEWVFNPALMITVWKARRLATRTAKAERAKTISRPRLKIRG